MARAILLGSNNPHKLREFRAMLDPLQIRVLSPSDLDVSLAVNETGKTFAENALLKAEAFRRAAGLISLADDSGLVVDALGGEPGVYSARYGGEGKTDAQRVELLLERLRETPGLGRTARFVAAIAVACPGRSTEVFEAAVEGLIAAQPRGLGGFGYDPVFYYPPARRTFAQMSPEEKDAVSHRGRALEKAARYLQSGRCDGIIAQATA